MKVSRRMPPLDAELRALLDSERAVPTQPADVHARVMARARAALSQPPAQARRAGGWHVRARFAAAATLLLAAMAGAMAGIYSVGSAAPAATETPQDPPPAPPRRAGAAPPHDPPRGAKAMPRPSSEDAASYGAEMALLRQAQEQAAQGGFAAALAPLAEHARRFPAGRLVEEREALRIKALSKLDRGAEACRATEAFRKRFPRSVLTTPLGEMCKNPGD